MKNSKKILIITSEFPPNPGGIGDHAYNLAKYLQQQKYNVTVLADQRNSSQLIEATFDKKLLFEIYRIKLRKLRVIMYFNRIYKVLRLISENEIIIASGKFSLWIVAIASFLYNKKFIAVIHGSEVNYKAKFIKKSIDFSLKRFYKIIAVSNYTKSLVNHLDLKNIHVISNGFEIKETEEDQEVSLMGYPNIITVGSVSHRKGQQNVINLLPALKKNFPNILYHIIGTPTFKNEFEKIAIDNGTSKNVVFYGNLSNDKMYPILKASDIFVMLSENTKHGDVEGFGIALLEANNFGIPTIGAKNCGIEDAISNFNSGILIDNKSAEELSSAITEILNNYSKFEVNSKIWASKFSWDIIIKKYITILSN